MYKRNVVSYALMVPWIGDTKNWIKFSMTSVITAAYGSWQSPIDGNLVTAAKINFDRVVVDGVDTYWLASQPQEKGRMAIVHRDRLGRNNIVTPPEFNVRNRVHEYGGGAYTVWQGQIYFCNDGDQCIYHQSGSQIKLASPAVQTDRYADLTIDARRRRLLCIREDHSGPAVVNSLVAIDLDNPNNIQILAAGADFYASPSLSPNGQFLAWLSWNHPNLPWDGNVLMVAEIQADGSLGPAQTVAGGPQYPQEAIFQPQWSPQGILHFVSDRSGWGNLYRWQAGEVEPLLSAAAEFGQPQWVFGQSTYDFVGDRLLCTYSQGGITHLILLNPNDGSWQELDCNYTNLHHLRANERRAVAIGAAADRQSEVVEIDLLSQSCKTLQSTPQNVDSRYFSPPQTIAFPTQDGEIAYGFYYPPHNPDFQAPVGERPPLLVKSHGGPTAATSGELSLRVQYWTSRGFGYLDVNYRGSTGYGRKYQEKLAGQWGIVDVNDCIDGAKYLAAKGLVDGDRMAISGGSAGGYTTLCALTFHQVFKAGASYYGIGDLEALARDTHKFESYYHDKLVAPYPQAAQLYKERSPINFPEKLSCPTIFFQGLEDRVVPPNQSLMMVEALRKQKIPVAYVPFPDEQHGFRQPANIKYALESEFYFYAKIFGFQPAEKLVGVPIENLSEPRYPSTSK
jgi:dipeptidyl aminopeptidase/acylaminoacyl peptidase